MVCLKNRQKCATNVTCTSFLTIWDAPFENQHVSHTSRKKTWVHLHIYLEIYEAQFKTFPEAKKINHLMTYKSNFAKYIKVKSQPYQLSVSLSEWMLNNNHLFITLICYVLSLCRVNLQWIVLSKVPKLSWENATVSPKREKLFFPFPSLRTWRWEQYRKTVFDI